jgi:hypothetical protein
LLSQQLLRNAKSPGLVRFDICDEAAMQTVRRAGRLGKQGREFACRAGFGGYERQVLLARKLQGAASQCGKIAHLYVRRQRGNGYQKPSRAMPLKWNSKTTRVPRISKRRSSSAIFS